MMHGAALSAQQIDSVLRHQLVERAERDQYLMCLQAQNMSDSLRTQAVAATLRANGLWLDALITRSHWPTTSLVGTDGVQAAWLIAQHADALPEVQQRALAAIKLALASGEGRAIDMAYLEDRIRKADGKPQVYATQVEYDSHGDATIPPVDDPTHLDERRASVGMMPMVKYLAQMNAVNAQLRQMPKPAISDAKPVTGQSCVK